MTQVRKAFVLCLFLTVFSHGLFLFKIDQLTKVSFDEVHYVKAANQILTTGKDPNWMHPPLGKYLIAFGIQAFGDQPVGWRIMSTVFGTLTVLGVFLLAFSFWGRLELAFYCSLLTLFNHFVFVQARIAMLDTFMCGFLIFGIAFFFLARNRTYKNVFFFLSGVFFALGTASKWYAVVPWGLCFLLLSVECFQKKKGFTQSFISIGCFTFLPSVIYFLTLLPLFSTEGVSVGKFLEFHGKIFQGQERLTKVHSYGSEWWQWPLIFRPIWYTYETVTEKTTRGVLLIGNPLVMWAGVIALLVCVADWFKRKTPQSFWISYFYFGLLLSWLVIPRKLSFYYYYYPAALFLSFSLTQVFFGFDWQRGWRRTAMRFTGWVFLACAFSVFLYFYPLLSGGEILRADLIPKWMWFRSWI